MHNDLKQLVESLLKEPVLDLRDLGKGLTNRNLLVTLASGQAVVRLPYADAHRIVFRDHEAKALDVIRSTGLDVETLYYDPATGIKITRFLKDLRTFADYTEKDRIIRTAALMKRLHGLKTTIGVPFDPLSRYRQYATHVSRPLVSQTRAQTIITRLEELKPELTLCHNDWVPGNICFTPKRDYLIDYEYAGDNDPFFDVTSFLTENELTQSEKSEFLDAYFGRQRSEEEKRVLGIYEDFHNLLWCTWACMMDESRHEPVYPEIARMKLQSLDHRTVF